MTSCNWQNWSKCTHAIFAPFKYVTFEDDGADVDNDNGDHDHDDEQHVNYGHSRIGTISILSEYIKQMDINFNDDVQLRAVR